MLCSCIITVQISKADQWNMRLKNKELLNESSNSKYYSQNDLEWMTIKHCTHVNYTDIRDRDEYV